MTLSSLRWVSRNDSTRISSSRTAWTGGAAALVNAYSMRKRVEKARPSRWKAKAWFSSERPTRAMVESPRPATNATLLTNGIGPLAASRPMRWYSDDRLKSSLRVCSVDGVTVRDGVRAPPHSAASRSPAETARRKQTKPVMRRSLKRVARPARTGSTLWGTPDPRQSCTLGLWAPPPHCTLARLPWTQLNYLAPREPG